MKKSMLIALMLIAAAFVYAEGKPQATCPAMAGQAVNPKLYVDADGYRIYVCCGGCVKAVKADPAKYIAKLKAEGVEIEKTPQK
ncbi:MAG: hypothetical protein WCG03_03540 [Kiritimatiellales bacterium]